MGGLAARKAARRLGLAGKGRLAPAPVLRLGVAVGVSVVDMKFWREWEGVVVGWRRGERGERGERGVGLGVAWGPKAAIAAWVNSVSLPLGGDKKTKEDGGRVVSTDTC